MQQLALFNNANKKQPKNYYNCINEPIIGCNAFQYTAPMPLHTFLGVAQICLDIARDHCIALDQQLVESGNILSNNSNSNSNNTNSIITNYDKLLNEIEHYEHELTAVEE